MACDRNKTSGSLEFCRDCYKTHRDDIMNKRPWVKVLKNFEQRERRRREREFDNVSLDQVLDNRYDRERY